MDKYLKALKENVCAICVDSSDKGKCTLNAKETCAVELYFPQIIEVVHSIRSNKMIDYQNRLKETICTQCRDKEGGNCYLREDSNCSLDRYFPFIVDIIHKVDAGKI